MRTMHRLDDIGEPATVRVRVYRDGELVRDELCETEEEAAALVAVYEEEAGVECTVEDLSAERSGDEAAEIEPSDLSDAYPNAAEDLDRW